MKKFPKSNSEWTSLETIVTRMNGEYPYYFFLSYKEDVNLILRHPGYEVISREDEERCVKCLSKRLVYKGTKTKPDWWP